MATLATNKRASFDYELLERYEAGIVLAGVEVKSVRNKEVSLKESFVTLKGSELYLTNAHISPYKFSAVKLQYDPTRPRKLLLRKSEIKSLIGIMKSRGLTLVPIRLYTRKNLIKLEFAVAQGKKQFDKRHDIAKREAKRKMERALKNF